MTNRGEIGYDTPRSPVVTLQHTGIVQKLTQCLPPRGERILLGTACVLSTPVHSIVSSMSGWKDGTF